MARKYHIDAAGTPGLCRATKRCPYGDLQEDHFSSEAKARLSYELENTPRKLEFDPGAVTILQEIGPRQLPNSMWAVARRSLQDGLFSEHELSIVVTALSEEWKKLTALADKPLYQWGPEEQQAAAKLGNIAQLSANVTHRAAAWAEERKEEVGKLPA
jgi:hypothetical protein